MKKLFKNHDLFKIIGLAILLTAILTWIIPSGQFSGAEFYDNGIQRVGILNFFLSGIYSINYFLLQISMLLVVGGFYALLTKTEGYQALVEKVSKFVKGREVLFVLLSTFAFAVLTSISTNVYVSLVFIPFIITVILRSGMDKLTAFSATFGGMLIGILGATYSATSFSYFNEYMGTTYATAIWIKVAIFFVTYVLFSFFTVSHLKNKGITSKNEEDDMFAIEGKATKRTKTWPIVLVLSIIALLQVIGYIGWNDAFNLEIFENFHEWLMGISIGDHQIFSYIFGSNASAFGSWDLFNIQVILVIAMIVIAKMNKIKFDELLSTFADGAKKMLKPIVILVMVNAVFVLVYWSPIVATIANYFAGLTDSFNVFLTSLSAFIAGLFHTDFGFTGFSLGAFYANTYANNTDIITVVYNSMYGLVQFFAPTGALLMVGLSYLNIEYKTWFKYIWRFLIGITVCLLLIFTLYVYL